ncbi:MAG: nitrite reductase large subunit NirB [Magnetospirillum sp. WYHS-4]
MKERLVVVGNGMAGIRTVEELLKRDPGRYHITVFGAEPHGNYDRIQLSHVLSGEKELAGIVTHPQSWYDDRGIHLIAGDPVESIDRELKLVASRSGVLVPYDKLLLATGSLPVAPPIPGIQLPGVVAFRDIGDVEKMVEASRRHRRAVVIGGGLLGLEAANGLARRGMSVAVVHLMPTLMERQLDATAGELLKRDLDGRGLSFFTNAQTEEIYGDGRVQGLRLADGRDIPADLAVLAIGIRPNVALAQAAGLAVNRGVVVGDDLRTSDPAVFAVGECAEHRGQCYGLVAPLWEMAKVCADHLAGQADSAYAGTATATRLKVTGIEVFSAGDFQGGEDCEEIVLHDRARGVYRKLVVRGGRLDGAVLYGDAADGGWYFDLLKAGTDITPFRNALAFGEAAAAVLAGAPVGGGLAEMPLDAEICGCNGVSKGTILDAIAGKGLASLEEVKAHTKASASCGNCARKVEGLLKLALGEGFKAGPAVKPLCGCTDLDHDEVRRRIAAQGLKTIPAVMKALDWKNETGCPSCRPALNYYLLAAWPGEYRNDPQSRFVNERAHANIQKDGTFSVVPRMWGGLTTPAELKAIAEVAERHRIPTVKMTGGQRIDLLGVPKEKLPAIWKDLSEAGMVSGHAYGKAIRTVKTCVGSEWCRFGTQPSMDMGVRLEKLTWGSWTPHKFKLAVSGCPRNCAEATIKDFGVIAVDSGWELHVGGNGGIAVRVTDLLCKVETQEEVLEYAGAFLQLYREEARYLERTAPWVERIGIDRVKDRIVGDAAGRQALFARFLASQKHAQDDPWAERALAGAEAHEFVPLADLAGPVLKKAG